MAGSTGNSRLRKLRAENELLKQENLKLRGQLAGTDTKRRGPDIFRRIGAVICITLAVVLLFLGNLLFWTGNTIVNPDRYAAATAPIIKDPQVQDALAYRINQKLYSNIDIDQVVSQALPPKADFLAPTIANQVQQHSEQAIKKILQRPRFQQRWNDIQLRVHDRFIRLVDKHGSDGSIDISEAYSDVSNKLQGTKLSFLSDRPLPSKVGKIQLVSGNWLSILQSTIRNIDTWRVIAICFLAVFGFLGVWLSRNRRRVVEVLGVSFAASMLLTVILLKLLRESVASGVDYHYAGAVKQIFSIVTHPLEVQTFAIMAAALIMVFIAWISGGSSGSKAVRSRSEQLLSGNLHTAVFSHGENGFTRWVGVHKSMLQWLSVVLVAVSVLFISLTPVVVLVQAVIILAAVLIIEILAARK